MNGEPQTTGAVSLGEQLYKLLPEVYRSRDNGDLEKYFLAMGKLLDAVWATLDQRLHDAFPDNPGAETGCQSWILPYFARLLDVKLVSSNQEAQRKELAHAILWRKRKGTLRCIEEIAEIVGGLEVEIQEGWKRTLVTPRLGMHLLPPKLYGMDPGPNADDYLDYIRHPGFPEGTVDFRCCLRAVRAPEDLPGTKITDFNGEKTAWRYMGFHGTPCFSGSYEDISRRTVDLRLPDWEKGHAHPRRLLLYTKIPDGFFHAAARAVTWQAALADNTLVEVLAADDVVYYKNLAAGSLEITNTVTLPDNKHYVVEGFVFRLNLRVTQGTLFLENSAVKGLILEKEDKEQPVLIAKSVLVHTLTAAKALVQLEYCTVLNNVTAEQLQASDSVFNGLINLADTGSPGTKQGCIRFSSLVIKTGFNAALASQVKLAPRTNVFTQALFFGSTFGAAGCCVLHPGCNSRIRFGAEDGGEMGAFHEEQFCLRFQAILDKLADYLPVGIVPVIIPDKRLNCKPPQPQI